MTEAFIPKLVTPGQGKTVMLFGVRFCYKVVSADTGGSLAVLEVEIGAVLEHERGVRRRGDRKGERTRG